MAVAIWPELPTVDALLQARLAAGWKPLPTMMQDGPAILGYAACHERFAAS